MTDTSPGYRNSRPCRHPHHKLVTLPAARPLGYKGEHHRHGRPLCPTAGPTAYPIPTIGHYRFTLRLLDPVRLPPYSRSTWRAVIGHGPRLDKLAHYHGTQPTNGQSSPATHRPNRDDLQATALGLH